MIKALQDGRKKTPFPRIAMGMKAINTGCCIQFASYLMSNRVEDLNVFFNQASTFRSAKVALEKLGILLNRSQARFQSFPDTGSESNKLICKFFNQSGDLAQLKLSFDSNDYFGKIQQIEFIDKRNYKKAEDNDPVEIETLKVKLSNIFD